MSDLLSPPLGLSLIYINAVWFFFPLQKTILIGPFCSLGKTRTSSLHLHSSHAQFSFDKRDVSVKLLMVLQDRAARHQRAYINT